MKVKNRKKKVTKSELQELIVNNKVTEVDSKSGFTKPANPDYSRIELTPEMDVKLLKVSMVLSRKGSNK